MKVVAPFPPVKLTAAVDPWLQTTWLPGLFTVGAAAVVRSVITKLSIDIVPVLLAQKNFKSVIELAGVVTGASLMILAVPTQRSCWSLPTGSETPLGFI